MHINLCASFLDVPPWRRECRTSVRGGYCLKRLCWEVSTVATLHPSWQDQDSLLCFRYSIYFKENYLLFSIHSLSLSLSLSLAIPPTECMRFVVFDTSQFSLGITRNFCSDKVTYFTVGNFTHLKLKVIYLKFEIGFFNQTLSIYESSGTKMPSAWTTMLLVQSSTARGDAHNTMYHL